jgi:hypothetical protein
MSLAKARFEMVFDCRNEVELTSLGLPGGEKRAISNYVMVGKARPVLTGEDADSVCGRPANSGSIRPAFHDDDPPLSGASTPSLFDYLDPKSIATTALGAAQQMLKIRDQNGPRQSAPALKHAVGENDHAAARAFYIYDPSFKVQ